MRIPHLLPLLLLAGPAMADISDIVTEFQFADVIILGEIHDNPHHHLIQSDMTAAIQPSAIVFEMFTQEQASIINTLRWEGAGIRAFADDFEWHKTGWPAFGNYARILEADPEGVVFGATPPVQDIEDAKFEGAAAIYGLGAEYYGLTTPLTSDVLSAQSAILTTEYCGEITDNDLAGMIESNRLYAALFADTIFRALDEVGPPVIVITGNAFANEITGLPAVLRAADPSVRVVSLGQFEMIPDNYDDFGHILLSNAVDRKDPCLTPKG